MKLANNLDVSIESNSGNSNSKDSTDKVYLPLYDPMPIEPVEPTIPSNPDEPNDTIERAINTQLSSDQPGLYDYYGSIGDNTSLKDAALDVDLFKVQLKPGDRLNIKVEPSSPIYYYDETTTVASEDLSELPNYPTENNYPLDSVLRLFDTNGKELALNDYFYVNDEQYLDAFISYKADTAGDYYIGLSGSYNVDYKPQKEGSGTSSYSTGDYYLNVSVFPSTEKTGTEGDDDLFGTEGDDAIYALAGNDNINSLGGQDSIFGHQGEDVIFAGTENDRVSGGLGNDFIAGEGGNDRIFGKNGLDVITGGDGNDDIDGGLNADRLSGDDGDDRIIGNDGNDIIAAGDGWDTVYGNKGNDRIFGGIGSDRLFGNEDNDVINGLNDYDTLSGDIGNDRLIGGTESDSLDGGFGNDTLLGVDPSNFYGIYETDTLTGGVGTDLFILGDTNRIYYDDDSSESSGDYDYGLITDFNASQDTVQLKGSSASYNLDFYKTSTGDLNVAIVYDFGVEGRDEVIGIIEKVTPTLTINDPAFSFV